MESAFTEKWIQGTSPDDRTSEVAAGTLRSRFGAVLHYLPLAAKKAEEDLEYVHLLRVWTRRATAALCLYEDWLPRRRFRWLKKQLRKVRRSANDARDCDVLIERLKNRQSSHDVTRWLEAVQVEREQAQSAIVQVQERLWQDNRFARRIGKLVQRVRYRGEDSAKFDRFGDWARQCLCSTVQQFFDAVPSDETDEAGLHHLRIQGKVLRYAMELLGGAFPDEFRIKLYPIIEAMQDRLGEINDLATARARLETKIVEAGDSAETACWRHLLASEETRLIQSRQDFWNWCSPLMLRELRDGFETILGDGIRLSPKAAKPRDSPVAVAG